jgi:hypothetical protein
MFGARRDCAERLPGAGPPGHSVRPAGIQRREGTGRSVGRSVTSGPFDPKRWQARRAPAVSSKLPRARTRRASRGSALSRGDAVRADGEASILASWRQGVGSVPLRTRSHPIGESHDPNHVTHATQTEPTAKDPTGLAVHATGVTGAATFSRSIARAPGAGEGHGPGMTSSRQARSPTLDRLSARGLIGGSDPERLQAVWRSGSQASQRPSSPPGSPLDDEEYWSLRLVRDLARALFADGVEDAEAERLLAAYESALTAYLRCGLSAGHSD